MSPPGYYARVNIGAEFYYINHIISVNLYNKTRHSYIYVAYSGQTAGPNGVNFCVDTHEWGGDALAKKIEFLIQHFF